MHQLDRVARSYRHVAELRAAHDRAVVLDDHDARIELQRADQLEQGGAARRSPFTVTSIVSFIPAAPAACAGPRPPDRPRPTGPGSQPPRTHRPPGAPESGPASPRRWR